MKKLLIVPAILCAAIGALSGCGMVGNDGAQEISPDEKIVAPQDEKAPDEECPDCPDTPVAPDDGNPDDDETPPRPEKWVRDRMPRKNPDGDYKIPRPDKNIKPKI